MIKFRRPNGFAATPGKYEKIMRKAVAEEMVLGAQLMLEAIEDTPVYTGRTLVNYRFSLGNVISAARAPISKPQLPGKTSEMELGSEPRRSANFAQVFQEWQDVVRQLKRDPYQKLFMANNTPYFLEVEYGTYKTSEGHSIRTPPGGMVRQAESDIKNILKR